MRYGIRPIPSAVSAEHISHWRQEATPLRATATAGSRVAVTPRPHLGRILDMYHRRISAMSRRISAISRPYLIPQVTCAVHPEYVEYTARPVLRRVRVAGGSSTTKLCKKPRRAALGTSAAATRRVLSSPARGAKRSLVARMLGRHWRTPLPWRRRSYISK